MISAGNIFNVISSITPTNGASQPFLALYVGGTGNISIQTQQGATILFTAVPVGILYVAGANVNLTNTTATNLLALS